jgi:hypothetical protein
MRLLSSMGIMREGCSRNTKTNAVYRMLEPLRPADSNLLILAQKLQAVSAVEGSYAEN